MQWNLTYQAAILLVASSTNALVAYNNRIIIVGREAAIVAPVWSPDSSDVQSEPGPEHGEVD